MAHSGGFEPPTARFVAGYSIQLSYECVRAATIGKPPVTVKAKRAGAANEFAARNRLIALGCGQRAALRG